MRGEIWSYTTIFEKDNAAYGFEVPLTLAIIRILDGPLSGKLVTSQLTDLEYEDREEKRTVLTARGDMEVDVVERWPLVSIGMEVEMVTRKLHSKSDERGMIVYGYKFRPPLNPSE